MPVPTQPTKVSLQHMFYGSTHPDVQTLQAAIARELKVHMPVTGQCDEYTANTIAWFATQTPSVEAGVLLATGVDSDWYTYVPTKNFIRMLGLTVR